MVLKAKRTGEHIYIRKHQDVKLKIGYK